jgi:hypothetical protein
MTTTEIIIADTTTDRHAAKAAYDASFAACQRIWDQLMADDAFALCGGRQGWEQLREAYDAMRDEQTRRFHAWLAHF